MHKHTVNTAVGIGIMFLISSLSGFGASLIQSDFSSGTISGGVNHTSLNQWGGNSTGWSITGGQLVNDTSLTNNNQREGSVGITVDPTGVGTGSKLYLGFDYDIAAGDTLYVHLRGFNATGGAITFSQNTGATNGNLWMGQAGGSGYNMRDGTLMPTSSEQFASSRLVQLTGTGSYLTSIDLSSYPISEVSDYEYITLAFANNSTVGGGGFIIDNVSLTTTLPEPSSMLLFGFGALIARIARKKQSVHQD